MTLNNKTRAYLGKCLERLVLKYNEDDARSILSFTNNFTVELPVDLGNFFDLNDYIAGERVGSYRVKAKSNHIYFFHYKRNDLITRFLHPPKSYLLFFDKEKNPAGFYVEERGEPGCFGQLFGDILTFFFWLAKAGNMRFRLAFFPVYLRSLVPGGREKPKLYTFKLDIIDIIFKR